MGQTRQAWYNTEQMNHINPENLSNNAKKVFNLIEFDENEQLISEIRKHPFGLFIIYAIGTFITFTLLGVTILLSTLSTGDPLGAGIDVTFMKPIIIVGGIVLALVTLVMTIISAYLFQSDVVLITSEKISQFLHRTIFDRKISQLSIGDVQDVTVTQKDVFSRIFNYGTLVIETAGEQQNYTFPFTPNPYQKAKDIVGSHEENLKKYGN